MFLYLIISMKSTCFSWYCWIVWIVLTEGRHGYRFLWRRHCRTFQAYQVLISFFFFFKSNQAKPCFLFFFSFQKKGKKIRNLQRVHVLFRHSALSRITPVWGFLTKMELPSYVWSDFCDWDHPWEKRRVPHDVLLFISKYFL